LRQPGHVDASAPQLLVVAVEFSPGPLDLGAEVVPLGNVGINLFACVG